MIIHINRLFIVILNRLILILIIIQITQLLFHFRVLLVNYLLDFVLYCLVMISFIDHVRHGLTSSTPYHRFAFST